MLRTGLLSITPSSPDTPTTTPESDPIRQPLLLPEVQQSKGNQERYSFVRAWGSKGTGQGQFSYLWSVAVGSQGHVYVADPGNDRVQVWAPDTSISSDSQQGP
jgi:NHL repeat